MENTENINKAAGAPSALNVVLERLTNGTWTRSTIEEVIAALWMVAAILSFGFNFDAMGWLCSIKAASDMCEAIWFGWREAIADKRSNVKLRGRAL